MNNNQQIIYNQQPYKKDNKILIILLVIVSILLILSLLFIFIGLPIIARLDKDSKKRICCSDSRGVYNDGICIIYDDNDFYEEAYKKCVKNIDNSSTVISQKKLVTLPDIKNLSKEEAGKKLDELGIYYTWNKEYSDEIEEGKVIGYTSLKPGTQVKQGRTISIDVSSEFNGIVVEDYTNKNVQEIKTYLENNGIKVLITPKKAKKNSEYYKIYKENGIIAQSKKAGIKLKSGDYIELIYIIEFVD